MDIAILGYGTVGSGTVTVLDRNREIITKESGELIRVKAILDLRDFPGDPYEERITHNFEDILMPSFGWCKYMQGESSGERDIDREKREATHISIYFAKYDEELDRFVASEKIEK